MKKIITGFIIVLAITLLFVMGVSLYSGIDIIAKFKPIYDATLNKMVPNYWLALAQTIPLELTVVLSVFGRYLIEAFYDKEKNSKEIIRKIGLYKAGGVWVVFVLVMANYYEGNEVLVGGQVDAIMQNPYMLLTTNFMFNSSLPVFSLVLARLVLDALILYREKLIPQQVSFETKALAFIENVRTKANANKEKISIEKLIEELSGKPKEGTDKVTVEIVKTEAQNG